MHIGIEWHGDNFNVALCGAPGRDPFLTIKGCRIVSGKNGEFVSWPAKKLDSGKYWNHCYASETFAQAVLDEAKKSQPAPDTRTQGERRRPTAARDHDQDIPF